MDEKTVAEPTYQQGSNPTGPTEGVHIHDTFIATYDSKWGSS
ncbi:MAG TPA: hypothetical protein VFG90_01860 [Nitrososphaeraceae archaeon]|nr:hypothetical protein [Nitrososphaeraceae archaeon]